MRSENPMATGTSRSYDRAGGGRERDSPYPPRCCPPSPSPVPLSSSPKLHMRMMLQRFAHCPLDLPQVAQLRLRSLAQRLRQYLDHEPVRLLAERKRARFAAAADDPAGSAGETHQMLGLSTARAGGELGGEAGGQRQLEAEGEGRLQLRRARLIGVVEQRQVAAEQVVA